MPPEKLRRSCRRCLHTIQITRKGSSLEARLWTDTASAMQGQLLLSTFMEFWLSDGDCPLPGTGERSAPDTPKKPREGWQDFGDAWGSLLASQASLR